MAQLRGAFTRLTSLTNAAATSGEVTSTNFRFVTSISPARCNALLSCILSFELLMMHAVCSMAAHCLVLTAVIVILQGVRGW